MRSLADDVLKHKEYIDDTQGLVNTSTTSLPKKKNLPKLKTTINEKTGKIDRTQSVNHRV